MNRTMSTYLCVPITSTETFIILLNDYPMFNEAKKKIQVTLNSFGEIFN